MDTQGKKFRDLRVLIVDDSGFARSLCRSMLMQCGVVNIKEAAHGAEAIELLAAPNFDVMLMDWVMPVMSGRRTLQYIRRPEFAPMCTIPIIVATGHASRTNCIRAAEYGADAIIAKPFSINTLMERLDCALSPRRQIIRTETYMGPNWFDPARLDGHLEEQRQSEAAPSSPTGSMMGWRDAHPGPEPVDDNNSLFEV